MSANPHSAPLLGITFRTGLWALTVVFASLPFWVCDSAIDFATPIRMLVFSAGISISGILLAIGNRILIPLKSLWIPIGWWAAQLLSVFGSGYFSESLFAVAQSGLAVIFFLYVLHLFKQFPETRRIWLRVVSAQALVLSVLGLIQYCGGGQNWFPPFAKGIPYGTLVNVNVFAETLVMMLPLCVVNAIQDAKWGRMLSVAAAILSLFMIALSDCRACWVAVGAGAVIFLLAFTAIIRRLNSPNVGLSFFARRIFSWSVSLAIGLTVIVSIFSMPKSTDLEGSFRAVTSAEIPPILLHTSSAEERVIMWRHSLKLFSEHPFMGWGVGSWRFEAPRHGLKGFFEGYATRFYLAPHNDFFQAAAETGVVGLGFYLLLIGLFFIQGMKNVRASTTANESASQVVWVSSLGCWVVISFFGFPTSQLVTLLLLFLIGAMIISDPKETENLPIGFRFLPKTVVFGLILSSIAVFALSAIRFRSETRLTQVLESMKTRDGNSCLAGFQQAENQWYPIESVTTTPVAFYAAHCRFNQSDLKGAISEMERAYSIHPFHPLVLHDLANFYRADGDLRRAEAMYREVIFTFPDFAEAGVNLAELLLETGRKAEGAFQLRRFGPGVDFRWVQRLEDKYLSN